MSMGGTIRVESGTFFFPGMHGEFVVKGEPPFEMLRVDPVLEEQQIERLRALRARRDNSAASGAIGALKRAAEG